LNVKFKKIYKPPILIEIFDCNSKKQKTWELFKREHYLTADINKAARCFVACWDKKPVGFYAIIPLPSGTLKRAWRGHRLVVLSDYQGLGIGNRLAEWVGEVLIGENKRLFVKTANIKLGMYRDNSSKWRKTAKHRKQLSRGGCDNKKMINREMYLRRICFTHEYIGTKSGGQTDQETRN
jgi:GNAT superfamily N-acetyltransferase